MQILITILGVLFARSSKTAPAGVGAGGAAALAPYLVALLTGFGVPVTPEWEQAIMAIVAAVGATLAVKVRKYQQERKP